MNNENIQLQFNSTITRVRSSGQHLMTVPNAVAQLLNVKDSMKMQWFVVMDKNNNVTIELKPRVEKKK